MKDRTAVAIPHLHSHPLRLRLALYLRRALIAIFLLSLVACGSELEGTYSDRSGALQLEFRSGGEVRQQVMGMTMMGTYEMGDDEVIVNVNDRRIVFRQEDDRLTSGPLVLTRRDE